MGMRGVRFNHLNSMEGVQFAPASGCETPDGPVLSAKPIAGFESTERPARPMTAEVLGNPEGSDLLPEAFESLLPGIAGSPACMTSQLKHDCTDVASLTSLTRGRMTYHTMHPCMVRRYPVS